MSLHGLSCLCQIGCRFVDSLLAHSYICQCLLSSGISVLARHSVAVLIICIVHIGIFFECCLQCGTVTLGGNSALGCDTAVVGDTTDNGGACRNECNKSVFIDSSHIFVSALPIIILDACTADISSAYFCAYRFDNRLFHLICVALVTADCRLGQLYAGNRLICKRYPNIVTELIAEMVGNGTGNSAVARLVGCR